MVRKKRQQLTSVQDAKTGEQRAPDPSRNKVDPSATPTVQKAQGLGVPVQALVPQAQAEAELAASNANRPDEVAQRAATQALANQQLQAATASRILGNLNSATVSLGGTPRVQANTLPPQNAQATTTGALSPAQADQQVGNVVSGASNFLYDPLKPLTNIGESSVAASPQGSTLQSINTELLSVIQTQRSSLKLLTGFAFKQLGRATGSSKDLKEKLAMSNTILSTSVTAMNDVVQARKAGLMSEPEAQAAFEQLKRNINEANAATARIAQDDLQAYLSGAKDNLIAFEYAQSIQIPALERQLTQATLQEQVLAQQLAQPI